MIDEAPFPHCDPRVLHAPGECKYCDEYPEAQQKRVDEGIAFTGQSVNVVDQLADVLDDGKPKPTKPCPADEARGLGRAHRWGGNAPSKKPD